MEHKYQRRICGQCVGDVDEVLALQTAMGKNLVVHRINSLVLQDGMGSLSRWQEATRTEHTDEPHHPHGAVPVVVHMVSSASALCIVHGAAYTSIAITH